MSPQLETIAEVLCNLMGVNPNDDEVWALAMECAPDFTITESNDLVYIGK